MLRFPRLADPLGGPRGLALTHSRGVARARPECPSAPAVSRSIRAYSSPFEPIRALFEPPCPREPCVQADHRAGARITVPIRAPSTGRNPRVQASFRAEGGNSFWARKARMLRCHTTRRPPRGADGALVTHCRPARLEQDHLALASQAALTWGRGHPCPFRAFPRSFRAFAAPEPSVQAVRGPGARLPCPIRAPSTGRNPCVQARSRPGDGKLLLGTGIRRDRLLFAHTARRPARGADGVAPYALARPA
jgi:hypothetical protein